MDKIKELLESLLSEQTEIIDSARIACAELTVITQVEHVLALSTVLKTQYHFEQLIDVSGIDYLSYGQSDWNTQKTTSSGFSRAVETNAYEHEKSHIQRFAVCYQLLSLQNNLRLRVKVYLDEQTLCLPSVTAIWSSANWYEREVFDLFGFVFEGHPDLRRILTDYGFKGHPMRKDFPLEGTVEVRYDPEQKRVIYQPVSITERVLVPRVIRDDNRYVQPAEKSDES